jgi:ribosomal protein S18 acetylase RimI-like enzyme
LQVPRVRLLVRRSNQAARALYAQAGYRQIERRGSYYRDGEDAVVMERQVIKGG